MDGEQIKWIFDLKTGDKFFYKKNSNSKTKMGIITGVSKKCIYSEKLRIRKYPLLVMSEYSSHSSIYFEPIRLIKPNNVSEEEKIQLEKEYLIEQIINKKVLEKLSIEELKIMYKRI